MRLEALTELRDLLIEDRLLIGAQERADALTVGLHDRAVAGATLLTGHRLPAQSLVLRAALLEDPLDRSALRLVERERVHHAADVTADAIAHRPVTAAGALSHAITGLAHARSMEVEHALLIRAQERADTPAVRLQQRALTRHRLLARQQIAR